MASAEALARRVRRSRRRRAVLLVVWALVAYVWLGSPAWLSIERPEEPTVGEEARSMRLNIFLQSQAIEAYRAERGRLPYVLQEMGPPFQGVEYRRRDNRFYELEGRTDRVRLRYQSRQSPFAFVGSAVGLLYTPSEAGVAVADE